MGYGVGFRVAPGLRLRATKRGPRVSIGPRIARLHLGGGQPAASAGRGPFTVWTTLSGGGHTVPEHDRRGRASARKADAWLSQRAHLDRLLQAHTQPVTRAARPVLAPTAPVTSSQVRRELRREAVAGIPWWHLGRRRRARSSAAAQVDGEVTRRRRHAAQDHAARQAAADRWWQALLDADEETVLARLEIAYTDHAMPATPVAVTDRTAHLVVPVDTPERLIGKREPAHTDLGNLSLAVMSKTRRHELYIQAIGSAILAVAAETFAVAPGIERVTVAVVEPAHPAGPAVIALATLDRELVLPDGHDRPNIHDLAVAADRGDAILVLQRVGMAKAPGPLEDTDPDVRMVLDILDIE